MKKNMKNMLVFVMDFMRSLAINIFAQTSGDDPELIPITETPSPFPGSGPRIMRNGPVDIPVTPNPNPNPNPDPHGDGPRIVSVEPDVIPIKPFPGGDNPGPRVASVEPEDMPIVPFPGPTPGPRLASVEPDEIPIKSPTDHSTLPRVTSVSPTDPPIKPEPTPNPGSDPRIHRAAFYLDLILFGGKEYFGKYLIG